MIKKAPPFESVSKKSDQMRLSRVDYFKLNESRNLGTMRNTFLSIEASTAERAQSMHILENTAIEKKGNFAFGARARSVVPSNAELPNDS